jgi:hypothetical protein
MNHLERLYGLFHRVTGWTNIVTVEKTLTGKGPWVVGIKAHYYGEIASFFAAVKLDGKTTLQQDSTTLN